MRTFLLAWLAWDVAWLLIAAAAWDGHDDPDRHRFHLEES